MKRRISYRMLDKLDKLVMVYDDYHNFSVVAIYFIHRGLNHRSRPQDA